MNNQDGIITMEDDQGNTLEMRVIDMLKHQDIQYVLMQNINEDSDGSYIFRLVEDDETFDQLETIDDEQELSEVLELFEKKINNQNQLN